MNAVRAAVPRIPREEWTSHPRFRAQALLLGSHSNFRRVSRYLVDKASTQEFVGLHSSRLPKPAVATAHAGPPLARDPFAVQERLTFETAR